MDGLFLYDASADLSAQAKGPTLSALAIIPLAQNWDLLVRGGAFFAKTKLRVVAGLGGADTAEEMSDDSVDPLLGGGIGVHLGARFALRAEYTRYLKVGNEDTTGEADVDQITVGFTYAL